MKKNLIAIVAVFVAWSVLEFVIHGVLLMPMYERTAELWRPEAEMKMGLMRVVSLIGAIAFVLVYALLAKAKNPATGIQYGLLYGIGAGVSMGYGTYSFMPIPYYLALSWFLGTVVEATVAGFLVGSILKDAPRTSEAG